MSECSGKKTFSSEGMHSHLERNDGFYAFGKQQNRMETSNDFHCPFYVIYTLFEQQI